MKRLFYFTNSYPYTKKEAPFVEPEIEHLCAHFDVTIVSMASNKDASSSHAAFELPSRVDVVRCGKRFGLHAILGFLSFPFLKIGRSEMKRIMQSRRRVLPRMLLSAVYLGLARCLLQQYNRHGLIDDGCDAAYYTFWFDRSLMALSLAKNSHPALFLASRIHGYDLYEERGLFQWQPFQDFKYRMTNEVIFLTDSAEKYFIDRFVDKDFVNPFRSSRHHVNALGTSRMMRPLTPRKKLSSDSFVLVSCSNLIPLKRVDMIARALAGLKDLDIKWVHFGSGEEHDAISTLIQENGLNAQLMGALPNADVLKYYCNNPVHAFITASSTEGLPVSIQEAMAHGIPIIGTAVGGIPTEIDGNGILLPANPSIAEIRESIAAIYSMPPQAYEDMSARSFKLWEERFNNETCLKRTEDVLLQREANDLK